MKYALYGLPCAGKSTLLNNLSVTVINGSTELNKMVSGRFSLLPEAEKRECRIRYAKKLSEISDEFISDGHYAFPDGVVFTEEDGDLYDVFLYLYCKPEIISERLKNSSKNSRFAHISVENIHKWQSFEIESLRAECHKRYKNFCVINDISSMELQDLIKRIRNGFGSYQLARSITDKIQKIYPVPCELHICDGDKTIIKQDSFRICTENYITNAFDGNFYTDYQSLKFSEEVHNLKYNTDNLDKIQLNNIIYEKVCCRNYIVLSSGIGSIWKKLAEKFALKNVMADTMISADTKYFVVKILKEKGYNITVYGDGKNDIYMLKQADNGFLYIGTYLSSSLKDTDISGIGLIYDKSQYILADENKNISEDIAVCKSNLGINGSRLAETHLRFGKMLGEVIRKFVPNMNTAVIVLERGGRFFGDGLYTDFDGVFYSYNPKKDKFPDIHHKTAVIVDSVINTGKSVMNMIVKLKHSNPETEIFIATNVI